MSDSVLQKKIRVDILPRHVVNASVKTGEQIDVKIVDSNIEAGQGQQYEGLYSVVPSSAVQYLDTEGKYLNARIEVAAIPSNYGLITFDGSTLTVS